MRGVCGPSARRASGVEDRTNGRGARDVVGEDEEGRRAGDNAQAVALPKRVEDVVLRLGGLAACPLPVRRVVLDILLRPEAPDDRGLALLNEGSGCAFGELTKNVLGSLTGIEAIGNTHVLQHLEA